MSQRERPEQALEWVTDGTARLLSALASLDDAALDGPTLLPGWSRRYLVSHVANNASALRNLVLPRERFRHCKNYQHARKVHYALKTAKALD